MSNAPRRRLLAVPLLAIGLLAPAAAEPGRATAATPAITVIVRCGAQPERTTVRNNRARAVTVRSIASIYQPRSNEPFQVGIRIPAGESRTFRSGYGASAGSPRTLTRQYIYNDEVGSREGARVRLSNGDAFTDRC